MIGAGSHGKVFDVGNGRVEKRMKLYRLLTDDNHCFDCLAAESLSEPVALMRARDCRVPNIVRLVDVKVDRAIGEVHLTMEKLVPLNMAYSDAEVRKFIRQLFEAVAALHKVGIHHCDIKTENLMLTEDTSDLRVIDFGLARIDSNRLIKSSGPDDYYSRPYRAPEVILFQQTIDLVKTDTWAAGVCAAELLLNRDFLFGYNECSADVLSAIMTGVGCSNDADVALLPLWHRFRDQWDTSLWGGDSLVNQIDMRRGGMAADFIAKVLRVGPHNRPTAAEMLEHPYIAGSVDLCISPRCIYLPEFQRFDIVDRMFSKYDRESVNLAFEMLDFMSIPRGRADWVAAAVYILHTFKGFALHYREFYEPEKTMAIALLHHPNCLDFLSRYHLIV